MEQVYTWFNAEPKSKPSNWTDAFIFLKRTIDIVVNYGNNSYDIVECKYYKKEKILDAGDERSISNKVEMFKEHGISSISRYKIDTVMLTTFGVSVNAIYRRLNINDSMVLDDLF